MLSLVFVLIAFFLATAAILGIDHSINQAITGGSLLGILAAGLLLSWWHGRRRDLRRRDVARNLRLLVRAKHHLSDQSGAVLIVVALFMPLLLGIVGGGLTVGLASIAAGEAANASDAAVLAAAGSLYDNGTELHAGDQRPMAEQLAVANGAVLVSYQAGHWDMAAGTLSPGGNLWLPSGWQEMDLAELLADPELINGVCVTVSVVFVGIFFAGGTAHRQACAIKMIVVDEATNRNAWAPSRLVR